MNFLKTVFLSVVCFAISQIATAQTTYYSIGDGNWNDANNWSLTQGGGPAANFPGNANDDIAVIRDGYTIFYIVGGGGDASETIGELIIGQSSTDGTLVFFHGSDGAVNDNYTLVVTGDVTITNTTSSGIFTTEGGDIINGQTTPGTSFENNTHVLEIGGDLGLDAGTFDLESPNGGSTNLIFNGSSDQEITESGAPTVEVASTIEFNNSGTAPNNEVRISSDDFSDGVTATTTFTAVTFVHNNSGHYINTTNNPTLTLGTAVNFEILDGEFTLSSLTGDRTHTLDGDITISGDGIFNSSRDTNAGDGDGATGDVGNITLNGDLSLSGTGVFNVSSETGLPTIPANGADDGTLTLGGTNTITGGTLFTEILVLNTDFAADGATIYVGDDDATVGSITLAANVDVDLDDVTFTFVGDDIFMNDDTSFEINNVSGTGGTYTIADDVDAGTVINMTGANASFLVNDGTVNIAQNANVEPIFSLTGSGASITVNSGAVLDIYGTPNDDDDIGITIGGANQTITVNGGDLNIGATADNAGRLSYNASATNFNLTISNGGDVIIGEDFLDGNTAALTSTVTITGATSSLTIGDLADFDDLSVTDGTLTVQSENAAGENVDLRGTGTITNGTVTFADGLDIILSSASLTLNSGTLNIETTATTLTDTRFNLVGSFTQGGGTVNVATAATSITGGNLISLDANFTQNAGTFNVAAATTSVSGGNIVLIDDEVTFAINDGTFSALAGLTDATQFTGGNSIFLDDTDNGGGGDLGDSDIVIGDGLNAAATVNIGANLGAAATVADIDMLEVDGPNATITIGTDGTMNLGSSSSNTNGNQGRLLLDNTPGGEIAMSMTINGTVHVAGDFNIGDGIDVTVGATGELNVGLNDSDGVNSILFGDANGTGSDAISSFVLNGGTVNMGDGGARFDTGNSNNDPVFSVTNQKQLTVNSGTLNVNGSLEIGDSWVVFTMAGGTINIDPQGVTNYGSGLDVLFFDRGYVDITGGTITIIDPHASTGVGELVHWNPVGDPSSADEIQVNNNSGWTLQFGNGSSSSEGSADGFDLDIDPTWILPDITINNPTGSSRAVNFNGNTRNYVMDGALTITAGTFDIETSSVDLDNTSTGNFTLGNGGHLVIGGTGDHFPGSATESPSAGTPTSFGSYTINSGSSVTYNGTTQTVDIPGGANTFGDLIITGSGTKTLANAESVADSLQLQAGTFSASTNLTLNTGSVIVRSDGTFNTGDDIQGSNNYSISYTGSSKSSASEEFSGGGTFTTVTMNLNSGQTLTFHGAQTVQDLDLLEGIFADGGFTVTVNGDLTSSATHTGSGAIQLSGGSSTHNVTGDGTGSFTNLTLNDANGASVSTDLTINGTFTLTSGVFDIGLDQLSISSSGTISSGTPSSSTMIELSGTSAEDGIVKTFGSTNSGSPLTIPIGVGGNYTPVDVELISATGLGDLTIKPIDGNTATTDPSDLEISYYWRLSSTISNPTVTLDFTYDQTDVPGTANEVAFIPGRLSGATWTGIQDVAEVNETTNVITFDNVDYITGDFTTAEPSEFGVVATYYSRTDGDWTTAATWSTDGFSGSAASTIPSSGQVVLIGNSRTVTADANGQSAFSIDLQSTGTLVIANGTTGHSFETVSGTGTLEIVSNSATTPEFPGGEYSGFVGSSGGTVEYSGTGSYTLPIQATYNNLSITGSGTRTFPDADLTLNGNFTVESNGTTLFSDASNGDITIGGNLSVNDGTTTILRFPGTTSRSVSVTGDATIATNATLDVINSGSVTHSLSLGGALTNSGTFDMNTGGSLADVTFTGASSNSVSGSGSTFEFNRLIVNKGTSQSNVLTLSSNNITITSSAGSDSKPIELQNGTLQIDNNLGTFDLTTAGSSTSTRSFDIPSTAGLTLNNSSTTLQVTSSVGAGIEGGDIVLEGDLTIMDGSIIIGDDATGVTDNELLYRGTGASFDLQGGSLLISGGFRVDRLNQSDSEINATIIDFDISGGTLTTTRYRFVRDGRNSTNNNNDVDHAATVSASDEAGFEIVNTSTFNMDGGTINCVHAGSAGSGNNDGLAFLIGPSVTGTSTAGTVQILNSSTPSEAVDVAFASGVSLWNLNIGDGTTFIGDVGGVDGVEINLTVLNDFTLNLPSGEFFMGDPNGNGDAENYTMTIGNNLTITAGTFDAGEDDTDADENDIILNGTNHTIAITPTDALFHDITFSHSGTATFNNDFRFNGDWTVNSGTVDLTTNTVEVSVEENYNSSNLVGENPTVNGNAITFYDLTFNGDASATTSVVPTLNADVTVNNTLDLNEDTINITTTTLIVNTVTEDANSFITTSGNDSDGGVTRTFTTPSSEVFTYPLGSNGIARDVTVTATDAGTGTINVVPVATQNAFVSSGDALGVYWVITPMSFTSPTLSYDFDYDDPADVNGTETDYAAATFDGSTFTVENGAGDSFDDTNDTFTIANDNNGSSLQFLAGDDPDGFPPVETYYSISSVCGDSDGCDWTLASSWSTVSHVGAAASTAPAANNPVIIASGDSVYVFAAGAVSATTQINGVLHTREIDNSGIGTLSGSGTFYIERDDDTNVDQGGGNELVLPTLTAGVGTVHYYYSNGTSNFDVQLPASPTTYHNLSFSFVNDTDNPDWEFANSAYTITGDLTLNDGDIVVINGSSITSDGSGTFTMAGTADLFAAGSDNFPSNFSTYSIDNSGSRVVYNGNFEQTITTTANGGGTIAYNDVELEGDNHIFSGTFDVNGILLFDGGGGGLSLGSGTLSVGGTLDFDGQDRTSDSGDPVINGQTGTVVFDGGAAQSVTGMGGYSTSSDSLVFNNLTIQGASTAVTFPAISGVFVVEGTLTFANDATLELNSQDLILDGNYTNNSSNVTPFNNIDELILNHQSADQTLGGSSNITLSELTLQKASGTDVNITTPTTITSTLLMSNDGNITLSAGASDHDLTIASGATLSDGNSNNSWSANRQIEYDGVRTSNSALIMTGTDDTPNDYDLYFPVGTSGEHSPAQFDVSAITDTGDGTIIVKPVTGNSSSVTIGGGGINNFDQTLATDRYFIVTTSLITDMTGTFTFTYVDGDINGSESDYITRLWPGSGTAFEEPQTSGAVGTSSNAPASNQFGGSASTFINDATTEWITGTNASFTPPLFSDGSGAWDASSSWNTASDGTGTAGVPGATTDVTIEGSDVITMPNNASVAIDANTVEISGSATLDFRLPYDQANSTLTDVNGTGTIILDESPSLPNTIDASDILGASGGTFNYDYSSDATERSLPSGISSYNNLTITDDDATDDATLQVNTTVLGDLTVDQAILNTSTFTLEVRGSITLSNGGLLDPSSGTLNLAGSSAQSVPSVVSTINNLTLSNVGSKTLGAISINDLTIFIGTGSVDGGTNTITIGGNWAGTSAFTQSGVGNVLFNAASGDQDISGASSFHNIVVNKAADDVTLSGNLTVSGDITLTSGTINSGSQSITLNGTAAVQEITGSASSITLNDLIINKSASTDFELTTAISSIAGDLTLTSGDFISEATTGPTTLTVGRDFTLESGATFNQSGTTITTLNLGGNYTDNGGGITLPANIFFNGGSSQMINTALSVTNFTKSGGGDLTLNNDLTIAGTLTLTSGDIISTTTNLLTLTAAASNPTGSDGSHVQGAMAHTLASTAQTTKTFPLGDGTSYRPIEFVLNQTNATSRTYTAEIMSGAPTSRTDPAGINHVSGIRYYDVTQSPADGLDDPSGGVDNTVAITYGADDQVLNTANLRLVKDDGGGNWVNLMGNVVGTASAGTITSTVEFTSFSDFALASSTLESSLPVELMDFHGKAKNNKVHLGWTTGTELNNNYFEILRSLDGETFVVVGRVSGVGTSSNPHDYQFVDHFPAPGANFYRLKQVDFDGTEESLAVIKVDNNLVMSGVEMTIYPNPTRADQLYVSIFSGDDHTPIFMEIVDLGGKVFHREEINPSFSILRKVNVKSRMKPGVYFINLKQGDSTSQQKLIIN